MATLGPAPHDSDAAYDVGYQQALDDIARAILDAPGTLAGETAALRWCERNRVGTPTRILVSARLLRASASQQGYDADDFD